MIDTKKLRENLGNFSTGIIIACARKETSLQLNFLIKIFLKIINSPKNSKIFGKVFLKKIELVKKFHKNFWPLNSSSKTMKYKILLMKKFLIKLKRFLLMIFLE